MNGSIAIVCGAGIVSGKEIMALELGQGLRDAGAEVHFVTARWGNGEFGRRTEGLGFPTHRLWLGFISATLRFDTIWMTADQLRRWPALVTSYVKLLRHLRPAKVIHTNWHHVLLLWPFLRPERDIYWSHEVFGNKPQYRRLFRALANRICCFVAVSHAAAQSLVELGVTQDKVVVIHNGITDPAAGERPVGKEGQLKIGIAGQVGYWKGHEDLLNAFHTVAERFPDAQLHIFGKGTTDYEALLRKRAVELGINRNLVWRGFIKSPSAIYHDLSVIAIPSRCVESFGLTALEAAFFSIPVVASRLGGLREIVEDGVTGYLFESGDVTSLAHYVIRLLGDDKLRQIMGKNARNRAIKLFSRERFVRNFCESLQIKTPRLRKDVEFNHSN